MARWPKRRLGARRPYERRCSVSKPVANHVGGEGNSRTRVLEVRGLRKTYLSDGGGSVAALRGVDLSVDQGDFVALMGPSGSGKSTLLHLVAGLDSPTDGDIMIAGRSLSGMDESSLARARRQHIGIVFQFFNLLEGMTVLENVALPILLTDASRTSAWEKAFEYLDLLGLADKARKQPTLLSGGERQRLAIARALANEPTVLLADEPTGALDSSSGEEVLELFRRLHRDGQSILLVTHNHDVARKAPRVIFLRDGRVTHEAGAGDRI